MINKKVSGENLNQLKALFDENNLTFWLAWGTCLGAIREQDFITHDNDSDLEIYEWDSKRLHALIPQLESLRFEVSFPWGQTGMKLKRGGESTDIFFCGKRKDIESGQIVWFTASEYIREDLFSRLETVDFLGQHYKVPSPVHDYLLYAYGASWPVKNASPQYWQDDNDRLAQKDRSGKQDLEILGHLKDYFTRLNLPFCLMEHTCLAAARKELGQAGSIAGERIVIGAYRTDQKRILDGLEQLTAQGFVIYRGSYLFGSTTQVYFNNQLIQIKYIYVPERVERLRGCKWVCHYSRFTEDYFSRFDNIEVQGDKFPVPKDTNKYLDYFYGPDFWPQSKFQPFAETSQFELVESTLQQRKQLEIPVKEPWLPFENSFDNLLIPYGELLVVKPFEEHMSVGMIVLLKEPHRFSVRQIIAVTGRSADKEVTLSDFFGQQQIKVSPSNIIGQAVALRSRRLKRTVSLKSPLILKMIRSLRPLLRHFKKTDNLMR